MYHEQKLKREIVHISKFQNKILYQSKKNTWYILNFIEALAGTQMKVNNVLNNFYNFISNPAQCMCQSSTPIRNMYNLHNTKHHTIQYRNHVFNRKKYIK